MYPCCLSVKGKGIFVGHGVGAVKSSLAGVGVGTDVAADVGVGVGVGVDVGLGVRVGVAAGVGTGVGDGGTGFGWRNGGWDSRVRGNDGGGG